jgi:hypothetical protein
MYTRVLGLCTIGGGFTWGEDATGTHWTEGWVGPTTAMDDAERRKFLTLSGLELRPLGRPARSLSLSQLQELVSGGEGNKLTLYTSYYGIYVQYWTMTALYLCTATGGGQQPKNLSHHY